jgi:signal transduction histidine kinase
MKKVWNSYKQRIYRNFVHGSSSMNGLVYWRNLLFAESMIYLFPFCLIALIPGVYWSYKTGLVFLAIADLVIVGIISIIVFAKGIAIKHRKLVFMTCVYILSITIIYYVGLPGPGLLYLYAACVFGIFFFEKKYAFWFAALNTFIVSLMALLMYLYWVPWPLDRLHSLNEWIAVTSNLVFLCFITAALVPPLFKGLQTTIEKQLLLTRQLEEQQVKLEESYQQMQKKNEDLEQFAYIASHDLQEPLRMVNGFLAQLEKKYEGQLDEKARQYIYHATNGAKRMHQIIVDLLEYSRAGRLSGELESTDVGAVLAEVVLLLSKRIEETNADIRMGPMPVLNAPPAALRLLFQNLLDNAMKYQPEQQQPIITVEAIEKMTEWEFRIADNGIGISPEYYDRVFVIFQRLHQREEYSGTGVGLAICKKIIESLRGRIWVESEENKGTVFSFTLLKM